MDELLLSADGHISIEGRPLGGDPLERLGSSVVLSPDFTLRSYFLCLAARPDLARVSPFLPGMLGEFASWPARPEPLPEVEELVLSRVVEMVGYPGEPRLDVYVSLCGFQHSKEVAIKPYPVEMLLGTPLRLGRVSHTIFGDPFATMVFDTRFCLFEVVEAVAWQLSFHGAPVECALRR